jgi:hypothetical protein
MRLASSNATITDRGLCPNSAGVATYVPSLARHALPASDLFPLHNPAPTSGPRPAPPGTPIP